MGKTSTERIFYVLAMMAIAIVAVLIVVANFNRSVRHSGTVTDQNNAYLRVADCKTSIPPKTRTPADVDRCYDVVEKHTGIKLPRYDRE